MTPDQPKSRLSSQKVRLLAASVAVLVAFAWVMKQGALPILPPRSALSGVDFRLVVLVNATLLISSLLRMARCYFLIRPVANVPFRRIMSIACVAAGLLTFLPFRLGEVAKPAMLREKGRLSALAVTGTIGAERLTDGLVLSVTLFLGLLFAKPLAVLPDHIGNLPVPAALVPHAASVSVVVFGGGFFVMAVFYFARKFARAVVERVLGLVSQKFATKVADVLERISDGLQFLSDFRNAAPFLLTTLVAFYAHLWALQVLAAAVHMPQLSTAQAAVILGVLGLGFAVPNAPGFFGAIQLALYAGMAVYLPPQTVIHEGAAFVFLFYCGYIAQTILLTLCGLLGEFLQSRRSQSAELQAT